MGLTAVPLARDGRFWWCCWSRCYPTPRACAARPNIRGARKIRRHTSERIASASLREQIQQHLDQLVGEADRLRKALAALDPRSAKTAARKPPARKPQVRNPAQATATKSAASTTTPTRTPRTSQPAAPSPRRTAPGATKASVLAALAGGEALTAGQVAAKTGLVRGTVSATLSNLAKSGAVQKADRGYRLAPAGEPSVT
jgi:hypothetical protein